MEIHEDGWHRHDQMMGEADMAGQIETLQAEIERLRQELESRYKTEQTLIEMHRRAAIEQCAQRLDELLNTARGPTRQSNLLDAIAAIRKLKDDI